ncbi:small multi-drug export protein [Streptomyces sp. NPDC055749]
MARFAWAVLAGFVLGTPAVPFGLSLSLPAPVALLAVLTGSACCLLFAVFAMERVRARWQKWRATKKDTTDGTPPKTDRLSGKTGLRARRVVDRYGAIGFGVIGPALFGTWGSALLGAALGVPRWRLLSWLMVGVTLWCTVMLVASDAAFDAFGFG